MRERLVSPWRVRARLPGALRRETLMSLPRVPAAQQPEQEEQPVELPVLR